MINEGNVKKILEDIRDYYPFAKSVNERDYAAKLGFELGIRHGSQYPLEDISEAVKRYLEEIRE